MKKPALMNKRALLELFDILNHIVFSNAIADRPVFQALCNREALKLADMTEETNKLLYGMCFDEKPARIVFNTKIIIEHHVLVATLVHEMIHVLQFQNECKESHHGPLFQQWRRKIRRRHNIEV